jgi:hypothetical protein
MPDLAGDLKAALKGPWSSSAEPGSPKAAVDCAPMAPRASTRTLEPRPFQMLAVQPLNGFQRAKDVYVTCVLVARRVRLHTRT